MFLSTPFIINVLLMFRYYSALGVKLSTIIFKRLLLVSLDFIDQIPTSLSVFAHKIYYGMNGINLTNCLISSLVKISMIKSMSFSFTLTMYRLQQLVFKASTSDPWVPTSFLFCLVII